MHTYLVTGATGFLGTHLVKTLRDAGHKVVALVRNPSATLEALDVHQATGDILDAQSIKAAAEGCDGLFHCAGFVSRDPEDAPKMTKVNVEGTKCTLDAARDAGIKRVVYASTSGTVAISEKKKPIPHEDSPTPFGLIGRWPYYRSKLYAEDAALARNTEDFAVICINPSLLLGPGDTRGHSTDDIRLFLEKKIPAVPPGGLSYVDVRDVAPTMLTAMDKGTPGRRYLLGACNITFEEFLRRLERLSGVKAPWLPAPKNSLLSEVGASFMRKLQSALGEDSGLDDASMDMARYFWYLDASLARRELDFQPRDSIVTLRDTIQDMLENGRAWPLDPNDAQPLWLETVRSQLQQSAHATSQKLQTFIQKHRDTTSNTTEITKRDP